MHDDRDSGFARAGAYFVVTVRQNGDVRVSKNQIRIGRRETHARSIERCAEATSSSVLLAQRYSEPASPFCAGNVTTDDEGDERPSLATFGQDIEVVPFGPGVSVCNAVAGQMEMIDLVPKLRESGSYPAAVAFVVLPLPLHNLGRGTDSARRGWDLSTRMNRIFAALARANVQQPAFDLRRDGRDLPSEPR